MKRMIVFIIIFFSAIALSPLLINEKGYILIAMGDLTVESTVVTAVIMLVIALLLLLISLKILKGGIKISLGSWKKFTFANQRRGQRTFNQGIAAFLLEDYEEAEKLFAKSAEPAHQEENAYLLAAVASQKLNLASNCEHYLNNLQEYNQKQKIENFSLILVSIKLSIAQNNLSRARKLIDEHHKHIGHDERLLSLEIDLCTLEERYEQALDYLPKARKAKHISAIKIALWERDIYPKYFEQLITQGCSKSLELYWQKLSSKLKNSPEIVLAYCNILAANNLNQNLTQILSPIIKKGANNELLKRMRLLPIKDSQPLIALVQKHLHKEPHSSKWLSSLAHLAASSEQWGMAEKAFNSLMQVSPKGYDKEDLRVFSIVLRAQGEPEKALDIIALLHN